MPVTRSTSGRARAHAARAAADNEPAAAAARVNEPAARADNTAPVHPTTTEESTTTSSIEPTRTSEKSLERSQEPSRSSRTKASVKKLRLARAREALIELKVELASARIATLEAESDEDEVEDEVTVISETDRRVGLWLETNQPLARDDTAECVFPPPLPTAPPTSESLATMQEPTRPSQHVGPPLVATTVQTTAVSTAHSLYTNRVDAPPPPVIAALYEPRNQGRMVTAAPPTTAEWAYPLMSHACATAPLYSTVWSQPHNTRAPAPYEPRTQAGKHEVKVEPSAAPKTNSIDISELAAAITVAARTGTSSSVHYRYQSDLPRFGGAHQEWLMFKAAYDETAPSYTDCENVARLRKSLFGRAKEAVESLLAYCPVPFEIIKSLEMRFGRPDCIALSELERLRALPRLNDNPRDICVFSSRVSNIVATLQALRRVHYLYNPEATKITIEKLTPTLRYRWYDFAAEQPYEEPDLVKLSRFLSRESERCGPYAPPETTASDTTTQRPSANKPPPIRSRAYNVAESQSRKNVSTCPICLIEGHNILKCEQFNAAVAEERWNIARERGLCFTCLRLRNKAHKCNRKKCGVGGCERMHHSLLHRESVSVQTITNTETDEPAKETVASTWIQQACKSYLKIIPVVISGPAGAVQTHALLDDGSTVTLIDADIADRAGLQGPRVPLQIEAIGDTKASPDSCKVRVSIQGPSKHKHVINARTIADLRLSAQSITRKDVADYKHLQDLAEHFKFERASPKILIGQDNWHLLVSTKVRRGRRDQPVASLTALGWVLHGTHSRSLPRPDRVNYVNIHKGSEQQSMDQQLRDHFMLESLMITPQLPTNDPDQRAITLLEEHTTVRDKVYEVPLLWKSDTVEMPNNYENTLRRLLSVERKLDRDSSLKEKYCKQMQALIDNGYAEPAPTTSTIGRTWYLPHFAVLNPLKPDKLRIVHDAAATTKGKSLNDYLLKGPDMLQSLPGVLMRFRQRRVAVSADIKEMFMRVKIRPEDRDALRYLWRGDRRDDRPPDKWRMTSLIFGATCSPSTAIYVKDVNARRYEHSHPEACQSIIKNHYVDNLLDSFDTPEEAVRVSKEIDRIHREANYELRQWASSSKEVLDAIDPCATNNNLGLNIDAATERVLGLEWRPTQDDLGFNLDLSRLPPTLIGKPRPTKREVLRIMMSLFDPLGFVSPVTNRAKVLLQEVWRRGTDWDADIDADLAQQWGEWTTHLQRLKTVRIPRWYMAYSKDKPFELHVFVDASQSAYAAVAYWRAANEDSQATLALVAAKTKVAPLKLTSIPRLELQAAVLGSRLGAAIAAEHDYKPHHITYWTDSTTVLTWLRNGARSYRPFVAHRIAAVEEHTKLSDWRWVPTALNVADDATRDVPRELDSKHRWFRGPDFLRGHPDTWPAEQQAAHELTGEERVHHITESGADPTAAVPDHTRFSRWERLLRATARVIQAAELFKCMVTNTDQVNYKFTIKNRESDPAWNSKKCSAKLSVSAKLKVQSVTKFIQLTAEQLNKAEVLLIKVIQRQSFSSELSDTNLKTGRLRALSFHIDSDNLLKLTSRVSAAQCISGHQSSPAILDGNHHITRLLIEAVHRRLHHSGVEATVNECRTRYWVTRLRPATRTIVSRCLDCRRRRNVPPEPRTGNLPPCRLAHHERPFTYVGLDYFGPLHVSVGRAVHKRYVALFTCLTTRAVHLEVAASLSTESAVMALRRFIARRGPPTQVWSDNGTNLHGADRELRASINASTQQEASRQRISWRFIPPSAPFMGGAWERLVRSVKTALLSTLRERHPNEETLATLLAEVEFTVNNRPLTHVSVDPNDPEALTPNHFLLHGPASSPPPGNFNDQDLIGRAQWRASQRLADQFWARWVKEYLPDLQHRREPHGRGTPILTGDVVLVADSNLPRNSWPMGLVIRTFPGSDDIVRAVDIKTKGGVLRRPVKRLVKLVPQDVS